jgi:hypothetical protein
MVLLWFSALVLLFHLMKGVCLILKGAFDLVAPFFSERLKHKKSYEYRSHCKKVDELFNSIPSKQPRS